MARYYLLCSCLLMMTSRALLADPPPASSTPAAAPRALADPDVDASKDETDEPPEGYYAFFESPNATPPRVRPPPYRQVSSVCAGGTGGARVTADNLCGDLNRGIIPRNPMSQSVHGEPYPFEVIRNATLRFLSRALPVLRADDTLPRVAHLPPAAPLPPDARPHDYDAYTHDTHTDDNRLEERAKRSAEVPSAALPLEHRSGAGAGAGAASADAPRDSRKFCDGGGVLCMLYRAINGDTSSSASVERREDPGTVASPQHGVNAPPRYEGPPTPCPARVEYATPVFARNYQGVWRYVVQIPYEGYFTQTVEVTRCMQPRCHYLDGGCLSSPRWVSLLVAELHYPPASQPYQQDYQQYIEKRAGASEGGAPADKPHCDGHDELGCFQVRLYYDWFLVPGSCKCWRPDYFARYVRRKHNEL